MKKIITLSFAIYLILVLFDFANAQDNIVKDVKKEATAVVESFLKAQFAGDTETIKECLGRDLLKKRLKLLNNPNYAAFLRDIYKDSRFEILHYKTVEEDSIQIDVKIDVNEQESKRMRYLLLKKKLASSDSIPRFRIYSQKEIAVQLNK